MPGAKQYAVKVGNRFKLSNSAESASDSGSEDELRDVDPFAMIKKAEIDAVRRVKQNLKQQEEQKRQAKIAAATGGQVPEEQPARQPQQQSRREPRANNAPRRGPRNERNVERSDDARGQVGDGAERQRRPDGERRRGGPRRDKDRQSGDPRTGVKGREKRGGGGSYNWGKPGDEWEQKEDKPTPETEGEEKPEETVENTDQENQDPVPEEPKEPETMTLEDYLKQQCNVEETPQGPSRKANDGQDIKGTRLAKKQHYRDPMLKQSNQQNTFTNKKNVVPTEKLNFFKYRPARFNNRDNNNRDNNRRENNRGGRQDFEIKNEEFPTLGGAKN